jgi:hypothetical protein
MVLSYAGLLTMAKHAVIPVLFDRGSKLVKEEGSMGIGKSRHIDTGVYLNRHKAANAKETAPLLCS